MEIAESYLPKQTAKQYNSRIIGDYESPHNSPFWIILKELDASGKKKWIVVIDFSALYKKVIENAYPLPNITDILDHLGNAQYFSVFDFASDFH